jgi:hypothetical protein
LRRGASAACRALATAQISQYIASRWDWVAATLLRLLPPDDPPVEAEEATNERVLSHWISVILVGAVFVGALYVFDRWLIPLARTSGIADVISILLFLVILPFAGIYVLMSSTVLLSSLFAPFAVASTITQWPFGMPFDPHAAVFVKLSVEPIPVGCWTCAQLPPPTSRGLRHSLTYQDPRALEQIAEWLHAPVG